MNSSLKVSQAKNCECDICENSSGVQMKYRLSTKNKLSIMILCEDCSSKLSLLHKLVMENGNPVELNKRNIIRGVQGE